MGATGAEILLCRDALCANPTFTIEAEGTSWRSPDALETGVWFWRLRDRVHGAPGCRLGPIWEFFVRPHDTPIDTSDGVTLDVDRDGFDDVASAGVDGMQFELYRGGPTGLRTPPILSTHEESVPVSVGDVDGDGTGDLLQLAGGTTLRLGNALGTPRVHHVSLGWSKVAACGDVDGDGYADVVGIQNDLLVGARGGPGLLADPLAIAGAHVGSLATDVVGGLDLNGDGFGDAVAASQGEGFGVVSVYLGSPTGLSTPQFVTVGGVDAPVLIDAGDTDGDGYADVIAMAHRQLPGPALLFVLRGGPTPRLYQADPWVPAEGLVDFGQVVAGDVDGDGFTDVVVIRQAANAAPQAAIHAGGPAGLDTQPVLVRQLSGGAMREVAVGDVDGDGDWDLLEADIRSDNPHMGELQSYTGGSLSNATRVASWSWINNRPQRLLAR